MCLNTRASRTWLWLIVHVAVAFYISVEEQLCTVANINMNPYVYMTVVPINKIILYLPNNVFYMFYICRYCSWAHTCTCLCRRSATSNQLSHLPAYPLHCSQLKDTFNNIEMLIFYTNECKQLDFTVTVCSGRHTSN